MFPEVKHSPLDRPLPPHPLFEKHWIRVTSDAAIPSRVQTEGKGAAVTDYVMDFLFLFVHKGILQGLDRKDSTTIPPLLPPMELPEEIDVKNICVGIPKVCSPLTTDEL